MVSEEISVPTACSTARRRASSIAFSRAIATFPVTAATPSAVIISANAAWANTAHSKMIRAIARRIAVWSVCGASQIIGKPSILFWINTRGLSTGYRRKGQENLPNLA